MYPILVLPLSPMTRAPFHLPKEGIYRQMGQWDTACIADAKLFTFSKLRPASGNGKQCIADIRVVSHFQFYN